MSAHLGRRVSDLLDGQLSAAETDAAWDHVHTCHQCRDEVEREGWVKTRLSTLGLADEGPSACAPDRLKGALLGMPPGGCYLGGGDHPYGHEFTNRRTPRRGAMAGFAALGGGAAGAAVMGVLALGAAAPADIPVPDRRPQQQQQPISQVSPGPVHPRTPVRFGNQR